VEQGIRMQITALIPPATEMEINATHQVIIKDMILKGTRIQGVTIADSRTTTKEHAVTKIVSDATNAIV